MASTNYQDAMKQLGLQSDNADNATIYNTAGVNPSSLLQHTVKKEFVILGMTPSDFMKEHGSASFDFENIQKHFCKICEDFADPLSLDKPSKAV